MAKSKSGRPRNSGKRKSGSSGGEAATPVAAQAQGQSQSEQPKKRTNPVTFLQQVRAEGAKTTWPSRRETGVTTVMVFIMVAIAAVFFLVVDLILQTGVGFILDLGS